MISRALALVALLAAPSLAYGQSAETWKIGEIAALTGPASTVGIRLNSVSQMWAAEVNDKGGIAGRKIELITCNDEGRPEKAVVCLRELTAKGATILLGSTLTGSLRAILAQTQGGPSFVFSSPNVAPTADTYAYQVSPSDSAMTTVIAKALKKAGGTSIGMVAATDASGEAGVASANKVFPKEDVRLKLARIDLRATDATAQLASVAGSDIPLVYSNYTGAGAAVVVKSFANLGLEQPLLLSYGNVSSPFVEVIKDVRPKQVLAVALKSIDPTSLSDAGEIENTKKFFAAYSKKYGEPADMINLNAKLNVDTIAAVLASVKNPADPKAVKAFLESTPIKSVQTLRFSPTNHIGLGEDSLTIVKLEDKKWLKTDIKLK